MKRNKEYCDICDLKRCNKKYHKKVLKDIEKGLKDIKEGRSYLLCCATKYGKCRKSKQKIGICHECCTKQSKKWYKIGKKDVKRKKV